MRGEKGETSPFCPTPFLYIRNKRCGPRQQGRQLCKKKCDDEKHTMENLKMTQSERADFFMTPAACAGVAESRRRVGLPAGVAACTAICVANTQAIKRGCLFIFSVF